MMRGERARGRRRDAQRRALRVVTERGDAKTTGAAAGNRGAPERATGATRAAAAVDVMP